MFEWFQHFRHSGRRKAHRAMYHLDQAVAAEEHGVEVMEDLAAVSERKLKLLAHVQEKSREFEGGDKVIADAARAYREGFAALMATPAHLYPSDGEARREAMEQIPPSNGSTSSQPLPVNGLPSGSSPKALPNGVPSSQADPDSSSPMPPPRRPRGRPPGSKSKPRLHQPPTEGEGDCDA